MNRKFKRRTDVIGIFRDEAAIMRLVGAALLEQTDEWQTQNRDMQTEPMAELAPPAVEAFPPRITTVAA